MVDFRNGLYKLNIEYKNNVSTSSSGTESEAWHGRLVNLNSNVLNKMKNSAGKGINYRKKGYS